MITDILLENIKSIKNTQEIKLAPITLLIGDNGSGKSTFIQTLALFSQDAQLTLNDGQIVVQGGFTQLVNDNKKPIKIVVKGKLTNLEVPFSYLRNFDYEIELEYNVNTGGNLAHTRFKLNAKNENPTINTKLANLTPFFNCEWFHNIGTRSFQQNLYNEAKDTTFTLEFVYNPPYNINVSNWLNNKFTQEEQNQILQTLNQIVIGIRLDFENTSYVPALRGVDSGRHRLLDNVPRHPVNASNFNNQSQILSSSLTYNRDLESKISSLMEAILDRKCRSNLQQGILVSVETFNGQKWVNITNEGFGANPLVQLIYQFVRAPPNSMILLEEPEIHLFPAAQKKLIINLIKHAKEENKQLLITTHSEHIYSILLKYQEKYQNDVKMYFCQKDDSNMTKINEITESNRELLKDFLAMDRDELASILEASGLG